MISSRDSRRSPLAPRCGLGSWCWLGVLLLGAQAGLPPSASRADSIFSVNGLGEVIHPSDIRGRAMGGVALGVDQPSNLSPLNPAVLASVDQFTVYAEAIPELRRIEDDDGRSSSYGTESAPKPRWPRAGDCD